MEELQARKEFIKHLTHRMSILIFYQDHCIPTREAGERITNCPGRVFPKYRMPGRNMGLSVTSLVTADGTQVQCFWGAPWLPRTLSRIVLNQLVFTQEQILLAAMPLGESGRPRLGGLFWKPLGQRRAVGFVHRHMPSSKELAPRPVLKV